MLVTHWLLWIWRGRAQLPSLNVLWWENGMATTPALIATVKTDQVADIAFTAAIVSNLDQGGPGRSEAVVEVHKENLVGQNKVKSHLKE